VTFWPSKCITLRDIGCLNVYIIWPNSSRARLSNTVYAQRIRIRLDSRMRVHLAAGVTHCAPVCVLTASSISRDMTKIFYFRCSSPSQIRCYIENKTTLFPAAQYNGVDDCNVPCAARQKADIWAVRRHSSVLGTAHISW